MASEQPQETPTVNIATNATRHGTMHDTPSLSDGSTPPTPSDPSSLPPAALDLAAKLFDLAREGQTTLLSTYLSAGIPKNLTNAQGDTLLMLASYHGNLETVKMLLETGADPNVLNMRGQSIIAGAVFKGYDEVVSVLFEKGADIKMGHPNALDCAKMFKREELLKVFGVGDS